MKKLTTDIVSKILNNYNHSPKGWKSCFWWPNFQIWNFPYGYPTITAVRVCLHWTRIIIILRTLDPPCTIRRRVQDYFQTISSHQFQRRKECVTRLWDNKESFLSFVLVPQKAVTRLWGLLHWICICIVFFMLVCTNHSSPFQSIMLLSNHGIGYLYSIW